MMRIPFMKPPVWGKEKEYLIEAFDSGHHGGGGPFTGRCHAFMEQTFGIGKTLLTTSCTDALEMAALLIDAKPGDEFIVPSYTFSSTANAFVRAGLVPVFADIREDTLNIDETKIERLITGNTKAVVPIHYAGIPAEMDAINAIADAHGIAVIEDAAQAINSTYNGRFAGALAELSAFSFHATKSYSCGEGGALGMNDEKYYRRSEFLWEKGTDRSLVLRGEKNRYWWVDTGSSFLPSDMLAAMLMAQFEALEPMQERRFRLFNAYTDTFAQLANRGIGHTVVPDHVSGNAHAFWITFPTNAMRNAFLDAAVNDEVTPYIGYIPLHSSPMGIRVGRTPTPLPVTESVADRVARLPFYLMTDEEIDRATAVLGKCAKSVLG